MNYRKVVVDNHIMGVGETMAEGNISSDEYSRLSAIFSTMPEAPEGYYYMLLLDETWELVEKEPEPEEPELDEAEALEILLGGGDL